MKIPKPKNHFRFVTNEGVAISFLYEHAEQLTHVPFPLIQSIEGYPEQIGEKHVEREILIHCFAIKERVTVQLLLQGSRHARSIRWRVVKAVSWQVIADGNLQSAVWSEEKYKKK